MWLRLLSLVCLLCKQGMFVSNDAFVAFARSDNGFVSVTTVPLTARPPNLTSGLHGA